MPKYNSTPLEFAINVPVSFKLDTEPSKVVGKPKTGQWGDYMSYTYFAEGGKVFWPSEALHQELLRFRRGDTVTVTKLQPVGSQKISWVVDAGTKGGAVESTNDIAENQQLILEKLQIIIDALGKIYGKTLPKTEVGEEVQAPEGPRASSADLDF